MSYVMVALGANLGKPLITLGLACEKIQDFSEEFRLSHFYKTKAVSPIIQAPYINAVCYFKTDLKPQELFFKLESIETLLGKVKKNKEAPRPIDLDLLFFDTRACGYSDLEIPHPRWKERLFVLVPLFDLVQEIQIGEKTWNIKSLIEGFPQEEVQEVYDGKCSN